MPHLPLWLTRVDLNSMAPFLRGGQLVWTIRPRRNHRPRRGAVVVVDSGELGCRIVKRIVGLPGEHLRLEGSMVWIDGHLLAEPYATASIYRGTFDVPEGHYLLLGDNRGASDDSRSWLHPYVGRTEIIGVLLPRWRAKLGGGRRVVTAPRRLTSSAATGFHVSRRTSRREPSIDSVQAAQPVVAADSPPGGLRHLDFDSSADPARR